MSYFFRSIGDAIDGIRLWLVSSNNWLTNIASIVAIVAIVYGAIYWFVLRRHELKQQRWGDYQHLLEIVWGYAPGGGGVGSARQKAAVYRLWEYRESAYMTALAFDEAVVKNPQLWRQDVGPHAQIISSRLKKTRQYKRQSKTFS